MGLLSIFPSHESGTTSDHGSSYVFPVKQERTLSPLLRHTQFGFWQMAKPTILAMYEPAIFSNSFHFTLEVIGGCFSLLEQCYSLASLIKPELKLAMRQIKFMLAYIVLHHGLGQCWQTFFDTKCRNGCVCACVGNQKIIFPACACALNSCSSSFWCSLTCENQLASTPEPKTATGDCLRARRWLCMLLVRHHGTRHIKLHLWMCPK